MDTLAAVSVSAATVPEEIRSALQAIAGRDDRHAIVASLALRLAPLGYVQEVRVRFVDRPEATEAVCVELTELTARALAEPARVEIAHEARAGAIPSADGSEAPRVAAHASGSVQGASARLSRNCLGCGMKAP